MSFLCRGACASARALQTASSRMSGLRSLQAGFSRGIGTQNRNHVGRDASAAEPSTSFEKPFNKPSAKSANRAPSEEKPAAAGPAAESNPFSDDARPTIVVSSLPYATTDEDIRSAYGRFGEILNIRTYYWESGLRTTNIEFAEDAQADAAIEATNLKFYQGRQIMVRKLRVRRVSKELIREDRKVVKTSWGKSDTLWVDRLAHDITDEELAQLFHGIKGVKLAKMAVDKGTGKFLGYGWVTFHSVQEAEVAMALLRQREVRGSRVGAKFNEPRRGVSQQKKLEALYANSRTLSGLYDAAGAEGQLAPQPDTEDAGLPLERDAKLDIEPPAPDAVEEPTTAEEPAVRDPTPTTKPTSN